MKKRRVKTPSARRRKKTTGTRKKREGFLSDVVPFESRGELKFSVYGNSATGKTTFWSSFPGPILAILCSGGQGTNELESISIKDRKKVEPYYLETCDDLLGIAEELKTDTHYETVVIDHCTGIQDLRITEILGLAEIPVQKSWGMASRSQYGERANNMKQYLRAFMDLLDKKVVFVSQEGKSDNEGSEESDLDMIPTMGPALSRSVLNWFNPACNYIGRTYITPKVIVKTKKVSTKKTIKVEEKVRDKRGRIVYDYRMLTGPNDIYTTKFRVPKEYVKPESIADPTYEQILEIIRGE